LDLLKSAGIEIVIPQKKKRKEAGEYDKDMYQWRHLIENFFQKLKKYRAIATRYDKTTSAFLGDIYLVASII
jgi:transposase